MGAFGIRGAQRERPQPLPGGQKTSEAFAVAGGVDDAAELDVAVGEHQAVLARAAAGMARERRGMEPEPLEGCPRLLQIAHADDRMVDAADVIGHSRPLPVAASFGTLDLDLEIPGSGERRKLLIERRRSWPWQIPRSA